MARGGIGWAISGSIGVSIANPKMNVVSIIGDGSSLYGIQSLWTAAHYKLPILYIIANNSGYKILKNRLKSFHNSESFIGMDLVNPEIDFVKIANSMGVDGKKIDNPSEIEQSIIEGIRKNSPYLLDMVIEK